MTRCAPVLSHRNTHRVLTMLAMTALLGACNRANLSKEKAAAVVQSSVHFRAPRYASIPRVVSVTTGGSVVFDTRTTSTSGEMFGLEQLAKVDPVVAILRARGRVDVEEFVSAVPIETPPPQAPPLAPPPLPVTTGTGTGAQTPAPAPKPEPPPTPAVPMGSRGWIHTFRITPTAKLDSTALTIDDGEDDDSGQTEPMVRSFGPAVSRTPGWRLAIGTREFIKILGVINSGDKNADVAAGELAVDFLWRWRPSSVGDVFDAGSAEFQSLPEAVRQAAQSGGVGLETIKPLWSRAILRRSGDGWVVKTMDWTYGRNRQRDS